ncbi:restriction endonuclease subunit S [Klebsiella pasteurii]|uniref:restriction endonuclease subunit S n=1 Tax=Klebsiella pasteurii TaxID=2587529 RepID=UPI002543086D|nr:restriction endonuclease subunit S [Klebsiella pasteurii]WII81478.1 restriction endonuclease subunit S [Klebsiella pasteurii]
MGSKWEYIPLGELITLQRGHDLPSQYRIDGSVPIMGSSGITGFHNIAKATGPGVIVGRSGDSMGVVSFIEKDYWPLNTCLYITDFKGNDITYIYYLLKLVNFDIFNSGSAQKSLNRNAVYPHKVLATKDRELQKKIGAILSSFEERIINSNKINQTLEQMSQTLFKSWFVDFDPVIDNALDAGNPIPEALQSRAELRQKVRNSTDFKPLPADIRVLFTAEFEETGLGWVPKGWKEVKLSLLSKITSGKRPPSKFSEPSSINNVPVWGGNGIKWFTSEYLYNERYIITGRVGTLGTFYKVNGLSWPSDNALVIQPVNHEFYELIYQSLQTKDILSLNAGSTQPLLTQTTLGNITLITPQDRVLLVKFQSICDSFQKKISANKINIDLNTTLRDTLLPKLISGELSLEDLPNLVNQTEPA